LDDLPIQTSTCRGFSILLRIRHPPRRTGHSVDQQAAFGQGHPGHQEPGHHQRGAEEDQTWQRHAWGFQMIAEMAWLYGNDALGYPTLPTFEHELVP